ncbi:MAG: UDP-N-acetylmuramoyl-tripeptide--D-alanyl-D-alanine ligase [Rhodospirillales bacterium]|nr:UDP-N-acetylmuramoyl-tripeptide--D-alanyl-D-alanine ligase [Rhodospirillales bacterium]
MSFLLNMLLLLAFLAFAAKRLLIYLHALQQDDYNSERLFAWIRRHQVVDRKLSAGLLGLIVLSLILPGVFVAVLMISGFSATAYLDSDPRTRSKKKLVLTARAKRIYFPALGIALLLGLIALFEGHIVSWILLVQGIPLMLVLSNKLNEPFEKKVQKKFYDEAVAKLGEIKPRIIGITGSYGKTSVKHILGHILKASAPTLITPGSVNTVMGITRIIREQMEPNTKYFVVEMGAYGPGSIARLCALTPPDAAIIIAIGQAHYERFKTLDTVAAAKFELAQDTLSRGGHVTAHEQTLGFEASRKIYEAHNDHFTIVGEAAASDLVISSVTQTKDGLVVAIQWKGQDYTLTAPLYGVQHGGNIALAFACAAELGLAPEDIIMALARCPQITHRLEVKPFGEDGLLIDDAFNSNPKGFAAALELLPVLKREGGRTILITPGMVELGDAHDAEHTTIGELAAKTCDIVLAVSAERIPTFVSAYRAGAPEGQLLTFASFKDAEAWLGANRKPEDVVLIENDLPDLYERIPKL